MKLPITSKQLEELVSSHHGSISEMPKSLRIQTYGSVIDVYLTTGSFVNVRTYHKGKGLADLTQYLSWLKENKK